MSSTLNQNTLLIGLSDELLEMLDVWRTRLPRVPGRREAVRIAIRHAVETGDISATTLAYARWRAAETGQSVSDVISLALKRDQDDYERVMAAGD